MARLLRQKKLKTENGRIGSGFSEVSQMVSVVVSVVVSIRVRKMFAEMRQRFIDARRTEQDVRERQASKNF
jgi:hypothetical protein